MPDQEQIVDALQNLIEISRDGQSAYRDGAEHVKDPSLKRMLSEISLERAKFAGDLENEAVRWGHADVVRSGTALAAVQRGWTDLKSSLGGGDDTLLAALEAGDAAAQREYDRYIRASQLPAEILGIIRNQAQAVVGTQHWIRALRQQRKKAA